MDPASKKTDKEARKAEAAAAAAAAQAVLSTEVKDIDNDIFGFLPLIQSAFKVERDWQRIPDLDKSFSDKQVWFRARIQESRSKGKLAFLVLREQFSTVQGIVNAAGPGGKDFVKFVAALPLESVIDVYGKVVVPPVEIAGTTQQVEVEVQKVHCVSKAIPELPFQLKDANRPEDDNSEGAIRVSQETRLDNRILDLRTLAMQAIMRISSEVCYQFRESLRRRGFVEIHTPKTIGGASEGGANVFKFEYFGRPACLAQSPQLHKQMAIAADFGRVFEVAPVFRAENSNTHRHCCEFTGLDLEMEIKYHYFEALEVIEGLFKDIFRGLEERCGREIETVRRQYPCEKFKWKEEVLRLDFREGMKMLRAAGYTDIPEEDDEKFVTFDINTEQEKALGRLVSEKYDTDFYYMINYPLGVRPFYTMPHPTDKRLSNSYDWFMRGEEIVSGAQRVHDPVLLTERAKAVGIDVATIKDYIDSFRLGASPHAGIGIGLERVVMLFLGLGNIRKASMFPRDPKRLAP